MLNKHEFKIADARRAEDSKVTRARIFFLSYHSSKIFLIFSYFYYQGLR